MQFHHPPQAAHTPVQILSFWQSPTAASKALRQAWNRLPGHGALPWGRIWWSGPLLVRPHFAYQGGQEGLRSASQAWGNLPGRCSAPTLTPIPSILTVPLSPTPTLTLTLTLTPTLTLTLAPTLTPTLSPTPTPTLTLTLAPTLTPTPILI